MKDDGNNGLADPDIIQPVHMAAEYMLQHNVGIIKCGILAIKKQASNIARGD